MALLHIEGFGSFGTSTGSAPSPTNVVARKYIMNNEAAMTIYAGRLGGYALQLKATGTVCSITFTTSTDATLVVGLAMISVTGMVTNGTFLSLYDGGTLGMSLRYGVNGSIYAYRGSTYLKSSAAGVLSNGQWQYLEFKVVCGASGSYEVRVGGVNVLSDSGVNTKAGTHNYHDSVVLNGSSVTIGSWAVDDLYILDGSGSSRTDFLGNTRVTTIRPESPAGSSSQFTPSAGDNYACVDEAIANDDTDYVEDSTAGHKDLYNYPSPGVGGTIYGVQVNTDCRETDATSYSIETLCLSDVTESADTAQAISTTSYVTRRRILAQDPHGPAEWSNTSIGAAQFGVKLPE